MLPLFPKFGLLSQKGTPNEWNSENFESGFPSVSRKKEGKKHKGSCICPSSLPYFQELIGTLRMCSVPSNIYFIHTSVRIGHFCYKIFLNQEK